jgi:hypothetical protein
VAEDALEKGALRAVSSYVNPVSWSGVLSRYAFNRDFTHGPGADAELSAPARARAARGGGARPRAARRAGCPPPLLLPLPVALPYKGAARRVPPPPTVAGSETVSGRLILRS